MIESFPLRVSLLGGGTDYPEWFSINGGFVIGGAVDFYVSWGIAAGKDKLTAVEQEILEQSASFLDFLVPKNVFTDSSRFIGKGLGASSASLAALFSLLYKANGQVISKEKLISKITVFERFVLGKDVGVQDQIFTVEQKFFGLDLKKGDGDYIISPIQSSNFISTLSSNLYLVDTGIERQVDNIPGQYINSKTLKDERLQAIHHISRTSWDEFRSGSLCLNRFAKILNESWEQKRKVSTVISSPDIDSLYCSAMSAGALGGKLLGAGGGGFLLLVVQEENIDSVREALSHRDLKKVSFIL